jgi:hypothetical protein
MMRSAAGAPADLAERLWNDADGLMRDGVTIKAGDRTTIVVVERDDRRFILKRANLRGFLHTVLHLPLRSRAMWTWLNSARLEEAGILTPKPRVLFEERWGPFRLRSYLLSDAVDGQSLLEFVRSKSGDDAALETVADHFADVWRGLGRLRLAHRDMKATNFLVDRGGQIWLVDLDGMRRWPRGFDSLFIRARARDRERFLRNWQDRPEVAAVFRARIDTDARPGG